ncbi:MAG: NAD(+) synthase [Ureaplasma sp.]|nr:NAD(+) synthase [Ureaplasma sp.]
MKINEKVKIVDEIIKNNILTNHKDCYVIGISGGIDSLVTLQILIKNVGKDKVKAFYLPIEYQNDLEDINLISENLNINIETIDLTDQYLCLAKKLSFASKEELVNIKPKLRAIFLSSYALSKNGLVVSCLNYSEYYLGYFTKYGDSAGDIFPLINFLKCEIYELAKEFNLPEKIIKKQPSAGLLYKQTDEKDFGFSYSELDNYLLGKSIDPETIRKIKIMNVKNKHKNTLNDFIFDIFLLKDK